MKGQIILHSFKCAASMTKLFSHS